MTRTIAATCGALAVAAIAASAQVPPSSTPSAPRPAQSTRTMSEDKTVTVTGCVKPWGPGEAPPPLTAPSTSRPTHPVAAMRAGDSAKYSLSNVQAVGEEAVASSYSLTAVSTVNLSAHVNHKVEVSGTVMRDVTEPPPATTAATPVPPGTPPTTAAEVAAARATPTLRVTSLKMVATSCP
jgi:hypothetical protein